VGDLGRRGVRLRPEHARIAAATDHALDALEAALAMASGRWPLADPASLPAGSAREGWILGVGPDRPSTPRNPRKEQP
jgi:hypothetical protein